MPLSSPLDRRRMMGALAAGATALTFGTRPAAAQGAAPADGLMRTVPSSGEKMPSVGLGSWITFNVGDDPEARDGCADVMAAFFEAGGRLIDSSPMYGSAQGVIGDGLAKLKPKAAIAATKVWISSGDAGPGQIEQSRALWKVPRFDLLQVHNLLAWEAHLDTLEAMKAEGKLRYVGVSTSEGRRHGELEKIMASRKLDFIQLSYSPVDREAEQRLLPLAREKGIAVLVNRPFRQGELTERLAGEPLPGFAAEAGAKTWAQLILRHIVSHPAVTCAIPATTSVAHVRENIAAGAGAPLDEGMRRRIAAAIEAI